MSSAKFPTHPREMLFPFRKIWNGTRAVFVRLTLLGLLISAFETENSCAQPISREYEIKAVFLFNFAQFTDWPTNFFTNSDQPFVIGVLGNDPFGGAIESTVKNETWAGRKFEVHYFSHVEAATNCAILFIGRSERRYLERILTDLKDKPILTVSDIDNAANHGVCVGFVTEANKIQLRVNLDALKKASLLMSSKLLRVAQVIPPQKK